MTFEEWWNNISDYDIIKNSKKYGASFIKLLCRNAWLMCELDKLSSKDNGKKNQEKNIKKNL